MILTKAEQRQTGEYARKLLKLLKKSTDGIELYDNRLVARKLRKLQSELEDWNFENV